MPMLVAVMDTSTAWFPKTVEEKEEVRRQMHRLLQTTHFRNSKRYPALLRFIVEETLEGRGEFLKERLLGVRVFQRAPDYDTADDPIVRVTIAEIRKRIAQYYHEEAHETELRIELLSGRYEPEFYPSRTKHNHSRHAEVGVLPSSAADPVPVFEEAAPAPSLRRGRRLLLAGWKWLAVIAPLAIAAILVWQSTYVSAVDEFWRPLSGVHRSVKICIPSGAAGSKVAERAGILEGSRPRKDADAVADGPPGTFLLYETQGENVVFADVQAMQRISNLLSVHKIEPEVRLSQATTLDDLQQGPAVLIGGLDNSWTLRAVSRLHYRFAGNDQEQYWIEDSEHPASRQWAIDLKSQTAAVKRDYALIGRVHDDSTREVNVIVAGIGMTGTAAAAKFLVDPLQMKELRRRVGPGFRDHDFEAVLGLDVVNGVPGAPRILALAVF